MELCQRVLDGRGMSHDWKTSVIEPIFKEKGDGLSCGSYRGVKLLEHAAKIVERILERRIQTLINLNKEQFEFMPGKGTMDAIFIVRKMQEQYQMKDKKLYMCSVYIEKVFDGVSRKVMEWAMRKKDMSEVRMGSAYSEEFEVKVGLNQGSVLSPLLFAIIVDGITKNARRNVVNELLYADDHFIMSETVEDLKERFQNW